MADIYSIKKSTMNLNQKILIVVLIIGYVIFGLILLHKYLKNRKNANNKNHC